MVVMDVPKLERRTVRCWRKECKRVLMEVAGEGDVVVFKTCERCGSMNVVEMRSPLT